MDFLKDILGEELFGQLESKVNEHNSKEENKEKQVKIGNLGSGEYVGKGKFDGLQALLDGQKGELDEANKLIAELKKGTKGNEELQGKISGYEQQVADLQAQLAETKLKSAIKVSLLSEKCTDVDYVTFKLMEKLKEKNEKLELDENDSIKGWDDKLAGLKTQLPSQFESASASGEKKIQENRLPENEGNRTVNPKDLAEALQMQYANKE